MKRLDPVKKTLRELYLKSGNQCAFPGCGKVMINAEGNFIGQICHIEAAEEGGERFNPEMTNEDRRAFSNLVLMCYDHHIKTNNVEKHTVQALQKMKVDHEAKFTDIEGKIERSIQDKSVTKKLIESVSLKGINKALKWGLDEAELKETLTEVTWASERLCMLPPRTRQMLVIIISHLKRIDLPKASGQKYRYENRIMADEISEACDIELGKVRKHMEILEKYEIGALEISAWDEVLPTIRLNEAPAGWFVWGDVREFCDRDKTPLHAIVEELRFDLLD